MDNALRLPCKEGLPALALREVSLLRLVNHSRTQAFPFQGNCILKVTTYTLPSFSDGFVDHLGLCLL